MERPEKNILEPYRMGKRELCAHHTCRDVFVLDVFVCVMCAYADNVRERERVFTYILICIAQCIH